MKAALLFVCLVGVVWAETEQPFRRPLSAALRDGWTLVQLDADAQRRVETLWIGDAEGRPVPFVRQRDVREADLALLVRDFVSGRDGAGAPTVEFSLAQANGSPVRPESTELLSPGGFGMINEVWRPATVRLEVDASGPWAADVEVAYDQFGQGWISEAKPVQIYDFGSGDRRLEFKAPRLAPKWRLRIKALRGEVRGVRAVEVRAKSRPDPLTERCALGVLKRDGHWTLTAPAGGQRVHSVHLELRGPVAPVRAQLFKLDDEPSAKEERASFLAEAQIWNLPALGSRADEIRLGVPVFAERFRLDLPPGVEVVRGEAEIGGEFVWFVAEKDAPYFLHLAGEKQSAPGNLAALPKLFGGEQRRAQILRIGPPEPDPYGKPLREDISVVLKRWLPWIVALAVAVLTGVALRLLLPQSGADKKKPAA